MDSTVTYTSISGLLVEVIDPISKEVVLGKIVGTYQCVHLLVLTPTGNEVLTLDPYRNVRSPVRLSQESCTACNLVLQSQKYFLANLDPQLPYCSELDQENERFHSFVMMTLVNTATAVRALSSLLGLKLVPEIDLYNDFEEDMLYNGSKNSIKVADCHLIPCSLCQIHRFHRIMLEALGDFSICLTHEKLLIYYTICLDTMNKAAQSDDMKLDDKRALRLLTGLSEVVQEYK